jgi:hypothetical protein
MHGHTRKIAPGTPAKGISAGRLPDASGAPLTSVLAGLLGWPRQMGLSATPATDCGCSRRSGSFSKSTNLTLFASCPCRRYRIGSVRQRLRSRPFLEERGDRPFTEIGWASELAEIAGGRHLRRSNRPPPAEDRATNTWVGRLERRSPVGWPRSSRSKTASTSSPVEQSAPRPGIEVMVDRSSKLIICSGCGRNSRRCPSPPG